MSGLRVSHRIAFVIVMYLFLGLFVVSAVQEDIWLDCVLFISINFAISIVFIFLTGTGRVFLIQGLLYYSFVAAYIVKGVLQYSLGLNTGYSYITIGTYVPLTVYSEALKFVCYAHIYIVLGIIACGRAVKLHRVEYVSHEILLSQEGTLLLLFLCAVWVLVSTQVMSVYGIGLMGGEGVSLPFKLSGILYYSRTIVVPFLLILAFEAAVLRSDARLASSVVSVFLLLAISEIFVRTSKAPLFTSALQIWFVSVWLASKMKLNFKVVRLIVLMIVAGLIVWPWVETFRQFKVSQVEYTLFDILQGQETTAIESVTYSVTRLLHRFSGFLQLAGLIADPIVHDFWKIFEYGGMARYYTEYYLGYEIVGHLSSPSLLGASLILGGENLWPFWLALFVLLVMTSFRVASLFRFTKSAILAFIAFETIDCMIAGTVGASAMRLSIVFGVASSLEVIIFLRVKKDRLLELSDSLSIDDYPLAHVVVGNGQNDNRS